jgi:ligand-binding SRPBCC domain-containing protein
MKFEVTCELPEKVYTGMVATYRLRPIFGIPSSWVTVITQVDEPRLFIDEQRFGPYKFWHHEHSFREVKGGVEAGDLIFYALPFGVFGRVAHKLFVERQIQAIFEYRRDALEKRFGRLSAG